MIQCSRKGESCSNLLASLHSVHSANGPERNVLRLLGSPDGAPDRGSASAPGGPSNCVSGGYQCPPKPAEAGRAELTCASPSGTMSCHNGAMSLLDIRCWLTAADNSSCHCTWSILPGEAPWRREPKCLSLATKTSTERELTQESRAGSCQSSGISIFASTPCSLRR